MDREWRFVAGARSRPLQYARDDGFGEHLLPRVSPGSCLDLSQAMRADLRRLLELLLGVDCAGLAYATPVPVGVEFPGERVVGLEQIDYLVEPALQHRVHHRCQHLDAPVEVALHEIGGSDQVSRFLTAAEAVDPRVLEIAAHDRANPDRFGQAWDAGTQAADTAHDQVDFRAGASWLVQGVDQLGIDETVQ